VSDLPTAYLFQSVMYHPPAARSGRLRDTVRRDAAPVDAGFTDLRFVDVM